MRKFCILFVAILLSSPSIAAADGPAKKPGNLYLLGVAMDQHGEKGGWTQIGETGAWKLIRAGAILNGLLYTAEADGVLRTTDLATGKRKQVAKADFGNAAIMFASAGKLYTIHNNGALYRVDPGDGAWVRIGAAGAWKSIHAAAIFNNRLYTAVSDGALRSADLATGERTQIGKLEFGDTAAMYASADKLYTIETDGSLFRVDPGDGSWARVGAEGAYKLARAGAIFNDRLYTTESDGTLRSTKLATGEKKLIGNPDFGTTALMCAGADEIYTIETDGSLYRVFVKLPESVHEFDWCPEAIETVFRDQGKTVHGAFNSRMILGKKATHAGVMDGLSWLDQNAAKDDLVVLYIGCHGFADPNEGWGVSTTDGQILWGREIKAELGKLPCPVLVILSTCESGGFAKGHKDDPPAPPNVTALCACSEQQLTNNEIDISVAEALYGRADYNHDGAVDLDELIRYIQERYKGWWPEPKKGDGNQTPVLLKSEAMPGALPLTKVDPNLAAVAFRGALWSARVVKQDGDNYQIQMLGWNPKPGLYYLTNTVPRNYICLASDGPPLLVEKDGQWSPARLLSQDGEKYKIHYLSYEADHDEVVTKDRIKPAYAGGPNEAKAPAVTPLPPATTPTKPPASVGDKTPDAGSVVADPAASSSSHRPLETTETKSPVEGSVPRSTPALGGQFESGQDNRNKGNALLWLIPAAAFVALVLLGLGLLLLWPRRPAQATAFGVAAKQRCIHCNKVVKVRSGKAGTKFQCPGCGAVQRIGT